MGKIGGMILALEPLSAIRRRELTKAAFLVMQEEGVAGTTLERVAQRAGASKGIVLHYFGNKQQLFERTMRYANLMLHDAVVSRMAGAATASERLWAIVDGNFAPELFRPPICHAWLSLCGEVPRDRQLARIQRVIHRRMESNLCSALAALHPNHDAKLIALGITALIDGLWLRAGLQTDVIDRDMALAQVADYLRARVPSFVLAGST